MELHADISQFKNTFSVPTELIYNNLFDCSELEIKALLFVLLKKDLTSKELAENLFVSEDKALGALNYWSEKGVKFSFSKEEPKLNFQKQNFSESLSREECSKLLSSDEQTKILVRECSEAMGKDLQFAEIQTFISLNMFYGISLPVILTAIVYCKGIDKLNINYIKKVLLNWNDQGVTTMEEAEKMITNADKSFDARKLVSSSFSLGRNLTSEKEKELAEKWVLDFGFSEEMLKLACNKTVDAIGKVSFNYIDKILSSWHEKGAKTPSEVAELDKQWQNRNNKQSYSSSTPVSSNCSFNIEDLERLINK